MAVKFAAPKPAHTKEVELDALYLEKSTSTSEEFPALLKKHKATAIEYAEYDLTKVTAVEPKQLLILADALRELDAPVYATLTGAIAEITCTPATLITENNYNGVPVELFLEIMKKLHKDLRFEEQNQLIADVANLYLWEAATWTGNDKLVESTMVLKAIKQYSSYLKVYCI